MGALSFDSESRLFQSQTRTKPPAIGGKISTKTSFLLQKAFVGLKQQRSPAFVESPGGGPQY